MPKLPTQNEDQAWALAYSIAAGLQTMGLSIADPRGWDAERLADYVDMRACAIADRAVKRLRERKII